MRLRHLPAIICRVVLIRLGIVRALHGRVRASHQSFDPYILIKHHTHKDCIQAYQSTLIIKLANALENVYCTCLNTLNIKKTSTKHTLQVTSTGVWYFLPPLLGLNCYLREVRWVKNYGWLVGLVGKCFLPLAISLKYWTGMAGITGVSRETS